MLIGGPRSSGAEVASQSALLQQDPLAPGVGVATASRSAVVPRMAEGGSLDRATANSPRRRSRRSRRRLGFTATVAKQPITSSSGSGRWTRGRRCRTTRCCSASSPPTASSASSAARRRSPQRPLSARVLLSLLRAARGATARGTGAPENSFARAKTRDALRRGLTHLPHAARAHLGDARRGARSGRRIEDVRAGRDPRAVRRLRRDARRRGAARRHRPDVRDAEAVEKDAELVRRHPRAPSSSSATSPASSPVLLYPLGRCATAAGARRLAPLNRMNPV